MAISVVVSGTGFMGREVLAAVSREEDLEPVGVLEKFAKDEYVSVPGNDNLIPMSNNPADLIERVQPNVIVDFTNAAWTPEVAAAAIKNHVSLVIGTTGLSESFLKDLEKNCKANALGAVVAANFAIGAIVMIHLAKIASRF